RSATAPACSPTSSVRRRNMHVRSSASFMLAWLMAFSLGTAASSSAAARRVSVIEAVKRGDAAAVQALVAQEVDVNAAEPDGPTALLRAASEGHATVLQVLIEGGANVNTRSKGPSGRAPMGGRIPRVNDPLGLRAHRDPAWAVNDDGLQFTPIMWAAREGRVD